MTDEQIKQNAEDWVKPLIGEEDGKYNNNDVSLSLMKNAFIAGAHSRDEEIKQFEFDNYLRTKRIKVQEEIIEELRNPWISVKDRLPELNVRVLILNKNGLVSISRRKYDQRRGVDTDWKWVDSWHWANWQKHITHWMPIPELKKGGKK